MKNLTRTVQWGCFVMLVGLSLLGFCGCMESPTRAGPTSGPQPPAEMPKNGIANRDECPQHRVRITQPFYLGVHEVTQEQYEKVMAENPSHFKGSTLPVETASWDDAVEFCRRLSQTEGQEYRLPTEAEWEYACRAGTTTRYYWDGSDGQIGDHVWHTGNASRQAHPVGEKRPNAWGLFDMNGNVSEWCQDWYADDYANSSNDDPTGPATGARRVFRGGGWGYSPGACRSSYRSGYPPGGRLDFLGFRVVQVPVE